MPAEGAGGNLGEGKPGEAQGRAAPALGRLLERARGRFRVGQNDEAKALCAQVLDQGLEVREVFLLLADIYRFEGETRRAEDMLRRAAEAPPLAQATGWRVPTRLREVWVAPPPPVYWLVVVGGLVLAIAVAAAVWWLPWQYELLGADVVPLLFALVAGLLASSALAASGLIRTFDQELSEAGPAEGYPLWLYLLVGGLVTALLGLFIYLGQAWAKGEASLTLGLFVGSFLVLATILGIATGGGALFWWLGLNVLFESMLVGWALGSVASPREWWRE